MHIVLASIEKMVPTIEDCTSLLRVLARSATGQDFSVYTTFSTGARRPGDLDGPDEYHVVLVDNGRSAMLGTEFQDMLRCIRCAACMNHCPVYGAVGGHAYGWVYPGPMGAVLTPALIGVDQAGHLPNAIDLLRQVRERLSGAHSAAQADAPLARARIRTPSDAGDDAARPARSGGSSRAGPALYRLVTRAAAVSLGWLGRKRGRFTLAAVGRRLDRGARPAGAGRRHVLRALREGAAGAGASDERAKRSCNAIRRGLRRGPLPPDQAAMLRGRLATHPRQLIPARSRLPHAEQVDAVRRATSRKNSARVARVPDADAVPGAVADYLAAQNLPSRLVMAPHPELRAIPWSARPLLDDPRGPRRGHRRWSACSTASPRSPRPAP